MMGLSFTVAFCDEIAFTGSHQFVGRSLEFSHYIKLYAFFCMHCQAENY